MTALVAVSSQPLEALELAKRVNLERAEVKRGIRAVRELVAGQRALAEILEQPVPHHLSTVNAETFLLWAHRMNAGRAGRYLDAAQINPWRPLGRLTDRQRLALAAALHVPLENLDAWRLHYWLNGSAAR